MSSLEKMSIQGIRSFGQEDRHRGVVQFFSPLTLILGPNGTGKTTIIECLKYITTGTFPPGVGRSGGSFVHDPKIAHETEVKAQVRLQFRDVRGKVTVVQRSMLATQKGKKVEFKTLDGVIRYKMTNGETREINSKCAELDREMVSLLGVSQPVLEHVIFCHQEDSNWPLGEGKALKTKFDDIFASTRYVKALEAIRKFRMNQVMSVDEPFLTPGAIPRDNQGEIRELSTEVKYLKQNKEKVQQLRTDLEDAEDRFLEARTAIEKITEKQLPIEAQLNKIRSNNDNINRLYGEKEALAEKKREIERNQAEIQRNITEEFDGSKDELQQAIDDFERQEYEQKKKLDKIERQMTELDNELRRLTTEQTKLTNEQGRLEHEAESYKQWLVSRNNLVKRIAQDYQLQGKLETVINDKLRESKQKREEYEEKESGKQREVDEKRREHTRLETQLRMKAEQYKRNRAEVHQINQELSQVEASQDRLQDLANILHCKETELKDLEKEVDLGQLRSEVKKLEEEKNECTAKLRTLNSEVSRMSQESAARAQLEVSRKDKTQKADQIRRLKSKHEDTLSHLLGYVPESNMRRAVEAYVSQQSRLVRNGSDELRELRHNLTQMETERNMMKDRLAEKEQELKQLEEKMFNVSESDNFDEGLKRITEKLQQNVNEKGYLKGIVHLYNKFVSTLKKEDPGCPLCHRPFDQSSEVTELIEELEEKLNIVPDKLDKCSQVISTYKSKEERMLQMKPHKARIVDLKETEIPELNLKIRSHSGKIDSLKAKVGEKEEELDMQQMDEATAKSIQPDMVFVDKYQTEVQNLELQISHQASLISGSESSRTMQDVQSELQDAQLHLDSVSQTLSNRHQKINDHNNKLQRLGAHINELGREQVELKQNLQKRTQLEESRKELEVSNLNLQQEIQMAKTDIRPIQDEVERLVQEKETITNQGKVAWDQNSSQITKMKDSQKEVNGYQRQIHNYIAERKEEQLAESIEASCRLRQQCKRTEEKREDFSTTASSIKEDIAAQKSRERELQDNMLLILKQEQVDKIISKITELENKLGGIDVAHLQTELANKEDELRRLAHEKQTLTLKKEGKEGEIRLLKKSLKEDTYRTAEQDYTTKIVKLKTTEIANKDLEKYYKALDMTIMHYHKKKMAEINKIIRELWRNTYRGNDIETIEICSDEEEESGAAKKRRSYNYRVVMIKGDAALDMRGRCSAGQKVLASLIIRLALAETFCLHCGFFALDEPTTNLDRENIESLAYALVEIIKTRAVQRNFQLLVITHDEDFVELLGRSDYVDEFFKVSKDDGGFSRLSKAKVEDIHR